ncbi:MAG: DUF4396 domain-containing protein [Chthoniobacterales bacterium]
MRTEITLMPGWVVITASVALVLAAACALWIALDLFTGPGQHMWIMNLVWPITGLYAGPLALVAYYKVGRLASHRVMLEAKAQVEKPPGKEKPFWQKVALGSSHCGAGCTLADIVGEWALFAFPLTLFGMKIYGAWVVDYFLALLFGIFFQYFTIAPMRGLSLRAGLRAAFKADVLSLTAWQVGMYGWMAIATFWIFGHELEKTNPVFWFMMQIAMLAGFLTSYPVNWWLIRAGIKEAM